MENWIALALANGSAAGVFCFRENGDLVCLNCGNDDDKILPFTKMQSFFCADCGLSSELFPKPL